MYHSLAFTFLADIGQKRVCQKFASKDYEFDDGHFLVAFEDKGVFSIAFLADELLACFKAFADNGDKDCQLFLAYLDQYGTGNLYKDLELYKKFH